MGEVGGVNANLVLNEKTNFVSNTNPNSHFGVNVNLNLNTNANLASNTNANSDSGLNFYAQSNAEFSNLDKEKGANRVVVYSRPVMLGKNHMFIIVDGQNYGEGITISSLSGDKFVTGGKITVSTQNIENVRDGFSGSATVTDKKHYEQGTWVEKQEIQMQNAGEKTINRQDEKMILKR